MKKLLFFLLFLGIATVFFYCSKSSDYSDRSKNKKTNEVVQGINPLKLDDGSTCSCAPGYSTCKSECIFSDCCICWDPTKETGGCGCYYGIAKCKTAAIGKDAVSTAAHNVRFYHQRFNDFLKFLRALPADLSDLQETYKDLISVGTSVPNSKAGDLILVADNYYEKFYQSYFSYISSLNESEKISVSKYLDGKYVK